MTTISKRRESLKHTNRCLDDAERYLAKGRNGTTDNALRSLGKAGKNLRRTADHLATAGNDGIAVGANLVLAGGYGVAGTAHVIAGAATGVAAGGAVLGEAGANLFGRALQHLGRALLTVGNRARRSAHVGGTQYMVKDVLGDKFAKRWADDLIKCSKHEFAQGANDYMMSVQFIAGAVVGGALVVGDLTRAAVSTLDAARRTLAAAVIGGAAFAIELANNAVNVAELGVRIVEAAVELGEKGVDAAGAALQAAGKALIVAGNAVNSAHGTDTAVTRRPSLAGIAA